MKNPETQMKNGKNILIEIIGIKYGKISGKDYMAKTN